MGRSGQESHLKISVVIPVYNDIRITRSIDSILNQRHDEELELVIVDGGSTDETLSVVRAYGDRITTLISEPDKGIFDALNKGILAATGDYVGLLGADDRYAHDRVFHDVAMALRETRAEACYGDLVYVDDFDQIKRYWRSGPFRKRNLYLGWIPPHFTLFAKREVYDRVGLFNLKYRVAADYDHQLRMLLKHKVTPAYVDRVLVSMTLGGNSNRSIRNIARGNYESFLSWREHHLLLGILIPFLKPTRKIFQYFQKPSSNSLEALDQQD